MKTCFVKVTGLVQGVSYRAYARRCADRKGMAGYVKNLSSGDVEVVLQGSKTEVERILNDLKKGPAGCVVTGIKIRWRESPKMLGFQVVY